MALVYAVANLLGAELLDGLLAGAGLATDFILRLAITQHLDDSFQFHHCDFFVRHVYCWTLASVINIMSLQENTNQKQRYPFK